MAPQAEPKLPSVKVSQNILGTHPRIIIKMPPKAKNIAVEVFLLNVLTIHIAKRLDGICNETRSKVPYIMFLLVFDRVVLNL